MFSFCSAALTEKLPALKADYRRDSDFETNSLRKISNHLRLREVGQEKHTNICTHLRNTHVRITRSQGSEIPVHNKEQKLERSRNYCT